MSDVADASTGGSSRRRRRRPRLWREGRSTTRRWDLGLLAWAVCALGAGLLAQRAASALFPPETAEASARTIVWVALGVPVGVAFSRSRPRGLLRLRPVDVLYGIVFGVALRAMQGAVAGIGGVPAAWPSTFSSDGSLPEAFLAEALADTIGAAMVEEFFFRGVVLVCAYVLLRERSGRVPAAIAAVAFSTALFVLAHQFAAGQDHLASIALAAVGAVTGAFVVATGRVWPAVAVHMVFNATGYALVAAGTLLS